MCLQIAAAEILCFEAKIVAGDGLHAQYGLVEFHRLREILGAYRQVVEAGNLHHSPPMKAKRAALQRDREVIFRIVYPSLVIQDMTALLRNWNSTGSARAGGIQADTGDRVPHKGRGG